jgi:hypothetical protein
MIRAPYAAALALLCGLVGCTKPELTPSDPALADRIHSLVDKLVSSLASQSNEIDRVFEEANAIYEHEGIPSIARVGDANAYGLVYIITLGVEPEFRAEFMKKVRDAAAKHELPVDAVLVAETLARTGEMKDKIGTPSNPVLRDEILRILKADQAVRQKVGFDLKKLDQADRERASPLRAIFDRYGAPTYEMVGIEAADGFVTMTQHQPPEFRQLVVAKLKGNVDAGQADPAQFAKVYDATQLEQGKKQLYGERFACSGGSWRPAPIEDEASVNTRRARLGLMRIELQTRFLQLSTPIACGASN